MHDPPPHLYIRIGETVNRTQLLTPFRILLYICLVVEKHAFAPSTHTDLINLPLYLIFYFCLTINLSSYGQQ